MQTFLENTNVLERFSVVSRLYIHLYCIESAHFMDVFGPRADSILCTVCFKATEMAGYTCL